MSYWTFHNSLRFALALFWVSFSPSDFIVSHLLTYKCYPNVPIFFKLFKHSSIIIIEVGI